MLGALLFPCLALLFVFVAMTRPNSSRLFRGRYRRRAPAHPQAPHVPDPTAGLRDPTRPF